VATISKTQVDRLGERLKTGTPTELDLRLLDSFRRSFAPAYEHVVSTIRKEVDFEPTGRPAKSTTSIVEKLLRETIRLSQMHDIAGCRLVVADIKAQDDAVTRLLHALPETVVMDRRANPSHGYRAVHIVCQVEGQPIEVQVRTLLQHLWAELSEKVSDVVDPAIKYGGGDPGAQSMLAKGSAVIADFERVERLADDPSVGDGLIKIKRDLHAALKSGIEEWKTLER
jgi:hypothetical protein